jgi:hypothetical protein
MEILAISKQAAKLFNVDRPNLRNINELEVRKQYQVKISKSL